MKLVFVIAHPGWDERRRPMMAKLEAELRPQCETAGDILIVHEHQHRDSHLPGALEAVELGLRTDATHLVALPDDTILVPNFVEVMHAIIAARPIDIIDCLSNHAEADKIRAAGHDWYSTVDGSCLFAGAMPVSFWREALAYREKLSGSEPVPIDNGVNYWAISTGRHIFKPLPSPVQHDLTLGSLNGNAKQDPIARTSQSWHPEMDLRWKKWNGSCAHIGRTFQGQHWGMIFGVKPEHWEIERAYTAFRGGMPVSDKPHLLITTPAYSPPELAFLSTRDRAVQEIVAAGIQVTVLTTTGDSLVTRGRHCLMHEFLTSTATHMLQWDADLELLNLRAPIEMVRSGFDVVGGAYPFRDGSGRVVMNLRKQDLDKGTIDIDERGFMAVAEIGTGFMMTTRKAIIDLCMANPDRLYEADIEPHRGCPMWALFDAGIRPHPLYNRPRYLSEDYEFCRLWRATGQDVHCFTGASFRHWGKTGHAGTLQESLQIKPVEQAEAAQ